MNTSDTNDNAVYKLYYDQEPINLAVIIEDILKVDKYEQDQGSYFLEKEQMIEIRLAQLLEQEEIHLHGQ